MTFKLKQIMKLNEENVKMTDFECIRSLGCGGFASVELVRDKKTMESIALKKFKPNLLREADSLRLVMDELALLQKCKQSEFIVKYYGSLVSKSHCVVLMEACLGGDLWSWIETKGAFNEDSAVFYAACVLEGLAYLRGQGILYRDLKPENILLDCKGYAKIADLGFSRELAPEEKAHTIVGTAEYLSPEMLNSANKSEGYKHSSTIWSFGILVYEMLTGHPPFTHNNQQMLFTRIRQGFRLFDFPSYISQNAIELMMMLCRLKPHHRPELEQIVNYMWFVGFDWSGLREGSLQAPLFHEIDAESNESPLHAFEEF